MANRVSSSRLHSAADDIQNNLPGNTLIPVFLSASVSRAIGCPRLSSQSNIPCTTAPLTISYDEVRPRSLATLHNLNVTIFNAFQILLAAIQLDIGYLSTDNIFTNTSTVVRSNRVIISTNSTGDLYQCLPTQNTICLCKVMAASFHHGLLAGRTNRTPHMYSYLVHAGWRSWFWLYGWQRGPGDLVLVGDISLRNLFTGGSRRGKMSRWSMADAHLRDQRQEPGVSSQGGVGAILVRGG